ncbi:hypothetical protein [Streptomyces sp. NPDC021356]|uniref:hypothetical protein n=1 Tax=Streptomyces sp. NPDC021356 TaxID=3154900 RepID=UPI0033C95251
MKSRIARSLATGLTAAMLAAGAGVVATGTASAAPSTTSHVAPTVGKKCHKVKGHYRTVTAHGKTKRVWVKPHEVCNKK